MRPFVIVSVKDAGKSFNYDFEMPTDVPAGRLKFDILETLKAYRPKTEISGIKGELYCERLKRALRPEETLAEAGVWTGDVIVLM